MTNDRKEQLRTEFNEWARAGRGDGMEKDHRPSGEQAIALMHVTPEARVLDVGCGSGWATRVLAELAFNGRVTGIDISDEMVRVASESSSSFANVDFQVASAERLPFPDREFTHAFSMESLYYYANIPKALSELHRVLKPGSPFVTVVDFFFASRRRHTRSTRDWSSDVCSSDLRAAGGRRRAASGGGGRRAA